MAAAIIQCASDQRACGGDIRSEVFRQRGRRFHQERLVALVLHNPHKGTHGAAGSFVGRNLSFQQALSRFLAGFGTGKAGDHTAAWVG